MSVVKTLIECLRSPQAMHFTSVAADELERLSVGLETILRYTGETRHPNGVWDAHVIAGRLLRGEDQNGCAVPQKGAEIAKRKDDNGDKQPGSSQPWDF